MSHLIYIYNYKIQHLILPVESMTGGNLHAMIAQDHPVSEDPSSYQEEC